MQFDALQGGSKEGGFIPEGLKGGECTSWLGKYSEIIGMLFSVCAFRGGRLEGAGNSSRDLKYSGLKSKVLLPCKRVNL